MIRDDALSSLRVHVENDKILAGSKKPPVISSAIDYGLVDDKGFLIDVGVKMPQRRSLKVVEHLSGCLSDKRREMNDKLVEVLPKANWEMDNILICHYLAFIVHLCDEFLGRVVPVAGSLNGEQFHENNEIALTRVESLYDVEIPRHR